MSRQYIQNASLGRTTNTLNPALVQWRVGPHDVSQITNSNANTLGGADGFLGEINLLQVDPGTYHFDTMHYYVAEAVRVNIKACYALLLKKTGDSIYTERVLATVVGTPAARLVDITIDDDVTLEDGEEYYFGVVCSKLDNAVALGGYRYEGTVLKYGYRISWVGNTALGIPVSPTAWTAPTAVMGYQSVSLDFSTAAPIVYSFGPVTADVTFDLPRCLDEHTNVLCRRSVCASTGMTLSPKRIVAGSGLACGDAVIKFDANHNIAFCGDTIEALDGQTDEVDFLLNLACVTGDNTADLFRVNRTTAQGTLPRDFVTIGHRAKAKGDRTTARYSYNIPTFLNIAKNADHTGEISIEEVIVCRQPIILVGDSQTADSAAGNAATRLGVSIPEATGHAPWFCAASSSKLSEVVTGLNTSRADLYCNATPGAGDCCDIKGAITVLCGIGVNDIIADESIDVINSLIGGAGQVVRSAEKLLLVGLPALGPGVATDDKLSRIKEWNLFLHGLAIAYGVPYVDIYDETLADSDTYLADDVHYTAGGHGLVASTLASAINSNTVGIWPIAAFAGSGLFVATLGGTQIFT